jgi:hypothetical protein
MWEMLAQVHNEQVDMACGPVGMLLIILFYPVLLLAALFYIGRHVKRIADHLEGKPTFDTTQSRPLAEAKGIPVEDYATRRGTGAKQVIDRIRRGELRGFMRQDQWYVEE